MSYRIGRFSHVGRVCAALTCTVVVAASGTALACSIALPPEFEFVADPSDTTAPRITVAEVEDIRRGERLGGCSGSSCGDIASVTLSLAATDDTSPPSQVGFRVRVVEGSFAGGALPVAHAVDVSGMPFSIVWSETDPQSFRAVLEVVAVDRAGNTSAPALVEVEHGGVTCAAAGGGLRSAWGFAPVALALAAIVRRARRR